MYKLFVLDNSCILIYNVHCIFLIRIKSFVNSYDIEFF